MSQAFVRESDEQWLHEIAPTLNALIVYLTRENNVVRVYEQKNYVRQKDGLEIHEMSNGLAYAKDKEGKWFVAQ
jgi:GTP cyclohydrolase II